MNEFEEITQKILKFRNERNWAQFHKAKDLAISLSVESSELLELFLWKDEKDVELNKLREELADIFYSAFLLASHYGFNVKDIMNKKLIENESKYPVEKAKGSNKKYDEL